MAHNVSTVETFLVTRRNVSVGGWSNSGEGLHFSSGEAVKFAVSTLARDYLVDGWEDVTANYPGFVKDSKNGTGRAFRKMFQGISYVDFVSAGNKYKR